jgi:hypothetical protein
MMMMGGTSFPLVVPNTGFVWLRHRCRSPEHTVPIGMGTFTSMSAFFGNPGVFAVPKIDILYGCLAAGTRMADGSDTAIESFEGGGAESVRSGPGALS